MQYLPDYIRPGVQVLLVGINPGLRSAHLGHHFAGHSNRFWKLLYESRMITEPLGYQEDWRLPEWGIGLTNMIPRPTPGCSDLKPHEYVAALEALKRKVEQFRPPILALLGVTLGRIIVAHSSEGTTSRPIKRTEAPMGRQYLRFGGAEVFVIPNPSGRNTYYSYQRQLSLFQDLQQLTLEKK